MTRRSSRAAPSVPSPSQASTKRCWIQLATPAGGDARVAVVECQRTASSDGATDVERRERRRRPGAMSVTAITRSVSVPARLPTPPRRVELRLRLFQGRPRRFRAGSQRRSGRLGRFDPGGPPRICADQDDKGQSALAVQGDVSPMRGRLVFVAARTLPWRSSPPRRTGRQPWRPARARRPAAAPRARSRRAWRRGWYSGVRGGWKTRSLAPWRSSSMCRCVGVDASAIVVRARRFLSARGRVDGEKPIRPELARRSAVQLALSRFLPVSPGRA